MYTNQTTHYAIPLPLGTDLTTPMDYNEAMQALDTAVWGATQDAATATSDASNAVETANQAASDVGTLGGRVNTLEATVETQGNAIVGLVNTTTSQGTAIGNKFNSVAVADAYSPTSTYSVGDVVTFEGNRYKCITAVTTGEPFDVDKWQGEDIQTVIDEIKSDLSDLRNDVTATTTANAETIVSGFTATFQHCGGVVLLNFGGNGTLPSTQGEAILRSIPRANVDTPIFLHDASSGDVIRLGVDTSGHIYNNTTSVTCSPRGTAVYFTNQFD